MMKIIAIKISVEGVAINITISRAPSVASEPCEFKIEKCEFVDFRQAVRKVSECLRSDCHPGRPSISISTNDCNIKAIISLDETIIKALNERSDKKVFRYFVGNTIFYC